MLKKTLSIAITAILVPIFFVGIVNSQTLERGGIEEIIVTAQKTDENIQDVPIAVSAFSSESLELQQIETFGDLQFNAPNITFTKSNFTGANMTIRGVNSGTVAASGDGGVAFHVNSVPVPTRVFETEYYDLESVEILRGPQGTLYGANSTGGVVNMKFARPTEEFEGSVDIEIADYNHRRLKGVINMPIADNVSMRIAGMMLERDGFTENQFPGKEGEDIDGRDITSWRMTLAAELSENTIATFTYYNFEEDDNRARIGKQMCYETETPVYGCNPYKIRYGQPKGASDLSGVWGAIAGLNTWSPLDYASGNLSRSQDLRETYQNIDPVYKASEDTYILEVESGVIENYTINFRAAYSKSSVFSQQDYYNTDGSQKYAKLGENAGNPLLPPGNAAFPDGIVPVSAYTESMCGIFCNAISGYYDFAMAYDTSAANGEFKFAEVSVASDLEGPINFLAGVNFTEFENSSIYDVYWTTAEAAALSPLLGPRLYPSHYRNQTDPYELERKGLYTQVYYDATDDLRITIGARWNESEKSVKDRQNLVNSIILAGGTRVGDPVTAAVQTVDPALGLVLTGQGGPTLPMIPGLAQQREILGVPTSFTEEEVTGKVGFDWSPDLAGTDSTLIYGTFSRGYRPGAFNPPIDPTLFSNVPQTTDPEFIDAYEIGMKNVLLDNSLVANLTAFFYDYQGLQVSKIIARTSVNENIDAEMQGLEAEFFWSPAAVPGLRLDLQVSLLETEIANGVTSVNPLDKISKVKGDTEGWLMKDYGSGATCGFKKQDLFIGIGAGALNLNPAAGALDMIAAPKTLSPTAGPGSNFDSSDPTGLVSPIAQIGAGALPTIANCASIQAKLAGLKAAGVPGVYGDYWEPVYDLSGNELVQSPATTVHFGAEYTADFANADLQVVSRIDYYWQDDMFSRIYNNPRDIIEAWDVLNAQIIIQSTVNPWYVRIWGQNLMDDDNITGHYFTAEASGGFRNDFLVDPQMIGISFGARF